MHKWLEITDEKKTQSNINQIQLKIDMVRLKLSNYLTSVVPKHLVYKKKIQHS